MTTHDWLIVLACAVLWLGIAVAWLWRRDKANHAAFARLHALCEQQRARHCSFASAVARYCEANQRQLQGIQRRQDLCGQIEGRVDRIEGRQWLGGGS